MPYSVKRWTVEQIKQKRLETSRRYHRTHKLEDKEMNRASYHKYKHVRKAYYLKKLCGLTLTQYQQEHERVQRRCEICFKEKPLVVDHNHQTKRFRGLLCRKCNIGIGMLFDNPTYVANALRYLNDH